ncbi:uncharacterized protein LOC125674852 isoform X2 [Ostrea edulis]|uniref:uncharacterized protein LOC125674852 isoform X2 n=1 Tax=Ostrea edulis TaxID=37623 RepID=UPI0024AF95FE|nr:uncharacterized protein LOC125674852 isoform X2 [Ostrea edulis]
MKGESCPWKKHRKRVESLLCFDLTNKERRNIADAGYFYPGDGDVLECIYKKENVPTDRLTRGWHIFEDSQHMKDFKAKQKTGYATENITEQDCSVGSNFVNDDVSTCATLQVEEPLDINSQDPDCLKTTGASPWGDKENVDFVCHDGKGCFEDEEKYHQEKILDTSFADSDEAKTLKSQKEEWKFLESPSESIPSKQGVLTGRHIEIEVKKCGGKMQGKCGNEMANSSKWENKSNFRGKHRNKGIKDFCRDVFCKRNLIDLISIGCCIRDVSTGIKPNATTFVIFLLLAVQITDVNSNDVCLIKQKQSINDVESCPKTVEEWNKRAKEKRCDVVSSFCSNDSKVEYHCVLNPQEDGLMEVCADIWYSAGFCIEWNENGLQDNYDLDCKNYSTPCPGFYVSNMTYKYQECYGIYATTPNNTGDGGSSSVQLIIGITISIVVGICFGIMIRLIWRRKQARHTEMEKRLDQNENQTLTGHGTAKFDEV